MSKILYSSYCNWKSVLRPSQGWQCFSQCSVFKSVSVHFKRCLRLFSTVLFNRMHEEFPSFCLRLLVPLKRAQKCLVSRLMGPEISSLCICHFVKLLSGTGLNSVPNYVLTKPSSVSIFFVSPEPKQWLHLLESRGWKVVLFVRERL